MDVTSTPKLTVSATESNKRLAQPKPPEDSTPSPDKVAAKKAYEQPPRPTTNSQGQTLGQVVNETA